MPEVLPAPPAVVKFRGLDTLRCFAALAVVLYHSTLGLQGSLSKAPAQLLHNLPVGVDFFFLISGFLITYLLVAEQEGSGTISLSQFYVRRALRIFPLYYLVIGLGWLIHQDTANVSYANFLTFTDNFWLIRHDWTVAALNPLWSLCIEEQFYLLIPLLVLLIPNRRLPWFFGSLVVLSLGFRAFATIHYEYNWMWIYVHPLSRCDVLALGGLLAWRHFHQPIRWQFPAWALPAAVAYLVLLLSVIDSTDYTSLLFATAKKYLYVAPLAFIFCYTLFNQPTHAFHNSRLGWAKPVLEYLGKISYGLYMYHSIVIFLLDTQFQSLVENPFVRLGLIFALTIVVAAISYHFLEQPLLRLRHRFEVVRTVRA